MGPWVIPTITTAIKVNHMLSTGAEVLAGDCNTMYRNVWRPNSMDLVMTHPNPEPASDTHLNPESHPGTASRLPSQQSRRRQRAAWGRKAHRINPTNAQSQTLILSEGEEVEMVTVANSVVEVLIPRPHSPLSEPRPAPYPD
jgi:hypothetical protein